LYVDAIVKVFVFKEFKIEGQTERTKDEDLPALRSKDSLELGLCIVATLFVIMASTKALASVQSWCWKSTSKGGALGKKEAESRGIVASSVHATSLLTDQKSWSFKKIIAYNGEF